MDTDDNGLSGCIPGGLSITRSAGITRSTGDNRGRPAPGAYLNLSRRMRASCRRFLTVRALPMVLYNGTDVWDVLLNFKDIINPGDYFKDSKEEVMNFSYKLINIHSYSEEELLTDPEIISMVFWLDQVKELADITGRVKNLAGKIKRMVFEEYLILVGWIDYILVNRENRPRGLGKAISKFEKNLD